MAKSTAAALPFFTLLLLAFAACEETCGCRAEDLVAMEERIIAKLKPTLLAELRAELRVEAKGVQAHLLPPAAATMDQEEDEDLEVQTISPGRALSETGDAVAGFPRLNLGSLQITGESDTLHVGGSAAVDEVVSAESLLANGTVVGDQLHANSAIVGSQSKNYGPGRTGITGPGTTTFAVAQYLTWNRVGTEYPDGTSVYFHLRMPESFSKRSNASDMFHIHVVGYAYANTASTNYAIDLTFVGYKKYYSTGNLAGTRRIMRTAATDTHACCSDLTIYFGSTDDLYLRFRTEDPYYTSFRVDSMFVGNGLVLNLGDIVVVESPQLTL
jgi:hypothetical protein